MEQKQLRELKFKMVYFTEDLDGNITMLGVCEDGFLWKSAISASQFARGTSKMNFYKVISYAKQ
jgi:hypothetical protein